MEQAEWETFKGNMDMWVKDFNCKLNDLAEYPQIFQQNMDNTEHNYELIHELRNECEDLKKQIQTMKITQLLMIKKLFREDFDNVSQNPQLMEKLVKQIKAKKNK